MHVTPHRLLALALLAAPTQAGDLGLTRSGGALGDQLVFQADGDPLQGLYLIISFNEGPTPLALIDPGDPRVLEVGLDLLPFHKQAILDAGGTATVVYNVPGSPGFQGTPLYAQCVTLGGVGTVVDEISNQVAFALGVHDSVNFALGDGVVARQGHTASLLPDGTVLIAGGDEPDAAGTLTVLDTLEIFDPQVQEFTPVVSTLSHPRSTQTATVLADGRVLLLGGYDAGGIDAVATGDVYDPATGNVTPIAPMSQARTQHTATLLSDGRVFVAGGGSKFDLSDVLGSLASSVKSTEIYDPVSNTWSPGPSVPIGSPSGIVGHGASLLGSGEVLITGGVHVSVVFGIPIPAMSNDCYRYDPPGNSYVPTSNMPEERVYHGQITLADGRALVVGGADGDFILLNFFTRTECERYDAATNLWTSVAPLNQGRAYPNVVRVGGEILVVGGLGTVDVTTGSGTPEQAIEAAPGSLSSWTITDTMLLPREVARAVAIEGGERVVIAGTGDNGSPTVVDRTAEVYIH